MGLRLKKVGRFFKEKWRYAIPFKGLNDYTRNEKFSTGKYFGLATAQLCCEIIPLGLALEYGVQNYI